MSKTRDVYASPALLEQYLFFHYGEAKAYLPYPQGPHDALHYPVRAVRALLDLKRLPPEAHALDLGCAVGASSFELSRGCARVTGIDLSPPFIRAAQRMKRERRIELEYTIEGERRGRTLLRLPAGVHPDRVTFRVGDAMALPASIDQLDVAVLLNLIDRVPDPAACLLDVVARLRPGGQLIVASPYTWMANFTPKKKWLGGRTGSSTFDALKHWLSPHVRLLRRRELPFLIREHARKYQWSMAEGTCWIKRRT